MLCLCVNMYVYAGGGVYVHIEKPQDCAGVLLGHSRTCSESSCLGWGVLGWLPSYPPFSNPPQHWSYWHPWDCPFCSVNQNSCRVLLTTEGALQPPCCCLQCSEGPKENKKIHLRKLLSHSFLFRLLICARAILFSKNWLSPFMHPCSASTNCKETKQFLKICLYSTCADFCLSVHLLMDI